MMYVSSLAASFQIIQSVRVLLAVGAMSIALWPGAARAQETQQQPVPDEAAREAAVKRITGIFQPDYEAAQTSAQRVELAEKMFQTGQTTGDDPAAQHELFRIARDIYAKEGRLDEAWNIVDAAAQRFDIDAARDKASVLAQAARAAKTSQANGALLPKFDQLIHDSLADDRFDIAVPLAQLAVKSARATRDKALARGAEARVDELERTKAAFAEVDAALKKLTSDPNDAEANLTAGRYRAFVQGRWPAALPLLAKSNDEALREAAAAELANPLQAREQARVGDLWWSIAEDLPAVERDRIQRHAGAWYKRALPRLAGLDKIRLEKRIAELPEISDAADKIEAAASKSYDDPAVKLAIRWIISRQLADGGWNFDHNEGHRNLVPDPGSADAARNAATAMALLPLLRAGQTHTDGDYQKQVRAGLTFLGKSMKIAGNTGSWHETSGYFYSHGLATMAVAEAFEQTRDKNLAKPLQLAVNYIIASQDPVGGGWRYQPRQRGDTSVCGWQMSALIAAKRAGAEVPDATFAGVVKFLDSVQADGGSQYGYTTPSSGRTSTTAIGLYCRLHLGWRSDDDALQSGVGFLERRGPSKTDLYYDYYATKLFRELGGEAEKRWQSQIYDWLIEEQESEGAAAGTWYMRGGHVNDRCGRLGVTSLATLILQMHHNPAAMK